MTETRIRSYETTTEILRSRGRMAAAIRDRRPDAEVAALRADLEQEKIVAAARKVAERLPELDDARRTRVGQLLSAGFAAGKSNTTAAA